MGSSIQMICKFLQKILSEETIADRAIAKSVKEHNTFRVLKDAEATVKNKKGAGYRWEVKDSDVVKRHLDYLCPNDATNEQRGDRYNNIRKYRSSKAKRRESYRLAFVRGEGKVLLNDETVVLRKEMPLGHRIDSLKAAKICFIENQENFMEEVQLIAQGWTLVYPIGRLGPSLMKRISPNEDELQTFSNIAFPDTGKTVVIISVQINIPNNFFNIRIPPYVNPIHIYYICFSILILLKHLLLIGT